MLPGRFPHSLLRFPVSAACQVRSTGDRIRKATVKSPVGGIAFQLSFSYEVNGGKLNATGSTVRPGGSGGGDPRMDSRIPPGGSVGPGGIMLDANGNSVLGVDGKPMHAVGAGGGDPRMDPRIPPGGSVGPGGIILDADGNPVLGADGKPMYASSMGSVGKATDVQGKRKSAREAEMAVEEAAAIAMQANIRGALTRLGGNADEEEASGPGSRKRGKKSKRRMTKHYHFQGATLGHGGVADHQLIDQKSPWTPRQFTQQSSHEILQASTAPLPKITHQLGNADNTLRTWNNETGKLLSELSEPQEVIRTCCTTKYTMSASTSVHTFEMGRVTKWGASKALAHSKAQGDTNPPACRRRFQPLHGRLDPLSLPSINLTPIPPPQRSTGSLLSPRRSPPLSPRLSPVLHSPSKEPGQASTIATPWGTHTIDWSTRLDDSYVREMAVTSPCAMAISDPTCSSPVSPRPDLLSAKVDSSDPSGEQDRSHNLRLIPLAAAHDEIASNTSHSLPNSPRSPLPRMPNSLPNSPRTPFHLRPLDNTSVRELLSLHAGGRGNDADAGGSTTDPDIGGSTSQPDIV